MKNIFIYVVSIFMFLGCEVDNKGLIDLLNINKPNIAENNQTTNTKKEIKESTSVDVENKQTTNNKNIDSTSKEVKGKEISSGNKTTDTKKESKESASVDVENNQTSTEKSEENTTKSSTENNDTNITKESIRRESVKIKEINPSNWYVRVVVENSVGEMKTQSAQLGQIDKENAKSTHSLKSMSPYGKSYLNVVFKNPDGLKSGDYKTSFHMYQPEQEDSWTFTVSTDISHVNSDFLLHISGIFVLTPYIDEYNRLRYKERKSMSNPLLKNMKLIDKASSKEMAVVKDGKTQIFKFNMDGNKSKKFELVVQVDEVSIVAKKSKVKVMRSAKKSSIKRSSMKKSESFDLFQPPSIEDIK